MSWQQYVDEHLMCDVDGQGIQLTAAAIIGHDGSVWAQSSTFPAFTPEEITAIMNDFAEPGSLAPTGLFLGGVKYMVIQGEAGAVIRGKKVVYLWCIMINLAVVNVSPNIFCIGEPVSLYKTGNSLVIAGNTIMVGAGGATVKKTNQALIIGIYGEPLTPGQCNVIVERLGDYLIDQGL